MAQYTLLKRPSAMLAGTADYTVAQLLLDLQNPQTQQSKHQLLGAVTNAFHQFYDNLGSPLSSPLIFVGVPINTKWNFYTQTVAADLGILYTESQLVVKETTTQMAFERTETAVLDDRLASLQNQVLGFQAVVPTRYGLQSWTVSDSFNDTSKIDLASSFGILAADTVIELQRTSQQNYDNQVTIAIDDRYVTAAVGLSSLPFGTGASNGFVGTTHEVVVPENTNTLTAPVSSSIAQAVQLNAKPGTTLQFVGDGNLHADIAALTDNNPSTWFEYEVCNIPDALKQTPAAGYGFTLEVSGSQSATPVELLWTGFHDQSASQAALQFFPDSPGTTAVHPLTSSVTSLGTYAQPGQTVGASPFATSTLGLAASAGSITVNQSGAPATGGRLRLVLLAHFQAPQTLTHISILPNVLYNKRPVVVQVEARSLDTDQWIQAVPVASNGPIISGPDIWTIPAALIGDVRIVIDQAQAYSAPIGHLVWVEQEASPSADPALLNALLGQGVILDPSNPVTYQRIDGPSPALEAIVDPQKKTVLDTIPGIQTYLSGSGSSTLIGPLLEAFTGWRYAIALRDISFESITYVTTGELITQDFIVPADIKQISLDVTELIPSTVSQTAPAITYDISIDGGANWLPIAPSSHYSDQRPRRYLINPLSGSDASSTTTGIISTPGYAHATNPVTQLRLRARFTRPTDDPSATPRLQDYTLRLEGLV